MRRAPRHAWGLGLWLRLWLLLGLRLRLWLWLGLLLWLWLGLGLRLCSGSPRRSWR